MNEADTRYHKIDPKIKAAGWGEEGSRVKNEHYFRSKWEFTDGEIRPGGVRGETCKADYLLIYKKKKLAVIEAKPDDDDVNEGIAQAKKYAKKLDLMVAYSSNGDEIYQIIYGKNDKGERFIKNEKKVDQFLAPDELWKLIHDKQNELENKFDKIAYSPFKGFLEPRYYQEVAIRRALKAITEGENRILLTLATGAGKTAIAFQIVWKLYKAKWNTSKDSGRSPRILFLADRNTLADQAYNEFSEFSKTARKRILPDQIRANGEVPFNASIFFTIFQTFMSGDGEPYYGQYKKDFFDLVIIDECHRGGANDESNWRGILDYFNSAVQIGLTATPRRDTNVDTYKYFGDPYYIYSLKEGIQDGFLTPFKVLEVNSNIDDYTYDSEDDVEGGEISEGEHFTEDQINRIIEIPERELHRIKVLFNSLKPNEKTIIFCATQKHAGDIRDYINQLSINPPEDFCVRVTADDGKIGEEFLKKFKDNEYSIPTILTTSRKLSTGIDALNIRNIVLMRPIKNMVEFKQIIGRGTRVYEGKSFFTVIDYVNASEKFKDPEWDGDPVEPEPRRPKPPTNPTPNPDPPDDDDEDEEEIPEKIKKITLSDGKLREIKSTISAKYYLNGEVLSPEDFIKKIYELLRLPELFKSQDELKKLWSSPITRGVLLRKLEENGFGISQLKSLQSLVNAEDSDIYDVLRHIAYSNKPVARVDRVSNNEDLIYNDLSLSQKEFIEFIVSKYLEGGVEEIGEGRLSNLIELKYETIFDGEKVLGSSQNIKDLFISFQKHLYE